MTPVEAAHTVIETITQMAQEQKPLMLRVVPEEGAKFWKHYPEKDARDKFCKSRWYYHVHAAGSRDADEHGHFHLFLHRTQLPEGLEPKVWPPLGEKGEGACHSSDRAVDRHAGHSTQLVHREPLRHQ